MSGEYPIFSEGLPLGEWFRNSVILHPDVIRLGFAAAQRQPNLAYVYRDGMFRPSSYKWPAYYRNIEFGGALFQEYFGANQPPLPDCDPAVRIAGNVLRLVYAHAFIDPFRAGRVELFGESKLGGRRENAGRAVWTRPATWIDVEQSDLLDLVGRDGNGEPIFERRWIGCTVHTAPVLKTALESQKGSRTEAALLPPPKSPGGRPDKYDWAKVTDRLLVHLSTIGPPDSQEALVRLIESFFDDLGLEIPSRSTILGHFKQHLPSFTNSVKRKR